MSLHGTHTGTAMMVESPSTFRITPMMINFDPPEHVQRRGIISAGFTPRRVAEHEPFLRRKVGDLIDAVSERGECDFVRDIATPLPMYMIGELMGLPEADHEMLLHWSDLFATGGEEIREEVGPAIEAWAEYVSKWIAQRRGGDAGDLISLAVNGEVDGRPLSDVDLIWETMLVLVGGDETTRHVISGGLEALLRNPEQLQQLRDKQIANHADPIVSGEHSAALGAMALWISLNCFKRIWCSY